MSDTALCRQILDNSSDVHFMLDCSSGRLLYLSAAAGRRYGYTLEQGQILSNELSAGLAHRLERFAAGDQSRLNVRRDMVIPRASGLGEIHVDVESVLVLNEVGSAVALTGTIRDASQRFEWQQQQKKFASMLSHEFRTPLSTIDGAIQRLEMTGAHHDEATRKRYTKIQTAVDRLLAMLDEYLSPERLASVGRQRLANEIAPLALLETAAEQARARRAHVRVEVEGMPQWLRCDPSGLRLCLDILIDNAIKYTDDGTAITLIGKKATEGGIELAVSDQGAGIAPDEIGKLFDKGYRGHAAAAAGVAGSGLGLYMARAVVEVHGGTLTVENFSESGKKFRIWLPIAA